MPRPLRALRAALRAGVAVEPLAVQRLVEAGGAEVGGGEVRQVRRLEPVLLRELPAQKGQSS